MPDFVDESTGSAHRWELSREALDRLLQALEADRNLAGRRYELLRRRLIDLFSWYRCENPEELADETLNRLARRLTEGEAIEKIELYALGIARRLWMEVRRRQQQRVVALRELRAHKPEEEQEMLAAVEKCLAKLPESSRKLIVEYYSGKRTVLAADAGVSLNTLRNRALRIRQKLYECVIGSRDNG
jgi:DNA-directed RNA polymerase specialized sigma24 family protein